MTKAALSPERRWVPVSPFLLAGDAIGLARVQQDMPKSDSSLVAVAVVLSILIASVPWVVLFAGDAPRPVIDAAKSVRFSICGDSATVSEFRLPFRRRLQPSWC